MNEVIVVGSKQELIGNGYVYENIGKEFIYEGLSFLLKENGIPKKMTDITYFIFQRV